MKVSSDGNASAGHSESTGFKYGRRSGYLDHNFCLCRLFRKTPACISNMPSLPNPPPSLSLEANNRRSVKSHIIKNIFHQISSTQSSDTLYNFHHSPGNLVHLQVLLESTSNPSSFRHKEISSFAATSHR